MSSKLFASSSSGPRNAKKKLPGSWGHFNWKKIGLSTAKFKDARVCRESMPTEKAKAAFDFLTRPDELDEHGGILRRHGNRFYKEALEEQRARLTGQKVLWISSFDLFVNCKGIECAMESLAVMSWNLRSSRSARLERLEPLLRTQFCFWKLHEPRDHQNIHGLSCTRQMISLTQACASCTKRIPVAFSALAILGRGRRCPV